MNPTHNDEQDFLAMAGLWSNRDVTIESLRDQAWREKVLGKRR